MDSLELNSCRQQQAVLRNKISTELWGLHDQATLPMAVFQEHREMIMGWLERLGELEDEVTAVCLDSPPSVELRTNDDSLDNAFRFRKNTFLKLNELGEKFERSRTDRREESLGGEIAPEFRAKMEAPTFDGEPSDDRFAFKNFLAGFWNCAEGFRSELTKFRLLKSCLKGQALHLVRHLSTTEANFPVALQLLEGEYLDIPNILDQMFQQLLAARPKVDSQFSQVKVYLNQIRCALLELKNSYQLDFLEPGTPGYLLISHIVFGRLPVSLKRELMRKTGNSYPGIDEIVSLSKNLIKDLVRLEEYSPHSGNGRFRSDRFVPGSYSPKRALENFSSRGDTPLSMSTCKFCSSGGHDGKLCKKFATYEERLSRCKELRLCIACAAENHSYDKCPGNKRGFPYGCANCGSKRHYTVMCPKDRASSEKTKVNTNFQICDTQQRSILPIYKVVLHRNKKRYVCNCILDSGSQRSYFSRSILKGLDISLESCYDRQYTIQTFVGEEKKNLSEVLLQVEMVPGTKRPLPVLIDSSFNLKTQIDGMDLIYKNLREARFQLAAGFNRKGRLLPIQGLVGVDLLQFLHPLSLIRCQNGVAWETPKGIVPWGNSLNFLKESQILSIGQERSPPVDYEKGLASISTVSTTAVNFVLAPQYNYVDPYKDTFENTSVERGLDRLFSLELMGLTEEETFSDFERKKVTEFQNSVVIENQCYYVKLPWWEDKIGKVPSNYSVALAVLNRVFNKLEKENKYREYLDVFLEQEREGIVERIVVTPEEYEKYVWIPHRPVYKTEEQSTTKVRPVFNCSSKPKGGISINEAAYPGVNLMGNLLQLLLHFRSNEYVLLGDIRKAFLQIKLLTEEDKNRFCFFLKIGKNLVCFRYTTLIFGYNASPFILNFLLKHHADRYPQDECSKTIGENFYVDNLIKTGNVPENLVQLYTNVVKRLEEGHFDLRSCSSNCEELRHKIEKDGRMPQHHSQYEKVLGYNYDTKSDSLSLAKTDSDSGANTKRKILAAVAAHFDPLSLCVPVTIRGRIFISELWKAGLGWDETVTSTQQKSWQSLSKDLSQLSSFTFPRKSLREGSTANLALFCDASKEAYGFVAYGLQDNKSNLVFAKAKVAPLRAKSLPTLELLAVYLALKALKTILLSLKEITFREVGVAVDAQIVLSWVLSQDVKTKNVFARNRVRDIAEMRQNLSQQFGIDISFRYVPSEQNPADLLSRGVSVKTFKKRILNWVHGPTWLTRTPIEWPFASLNCLREENKEIVRGPTFCGALTQAEGPVIPFEKYETLNKLLGVVTGVFKFIGRLKHSRDDPQKLAWQHLIKWMQGQAFPQVKEYLLNPSGQAPDLVSSLSLFLDEEGVIRTRGRIRKCITFEYEVIYPVLLGKSHTFTQMIIIDAHRKCKHLGIASTLSQLRLSGFWIPRARQAVKSTLKSCKLCVRYNAMSFAYPRMTNLPKCRVNLIRPFLHTGVDFTGHIWVKEGGNIRKVYLLLFTCLTTRGIHLEVVDDMTVYSFILAFIRFTNNVGVPSHLYSDNAKTFTTGGRIIQQAYGSEEYNSIFRTYSVKHLTLPVYAAWFGGTWERLIRTVKTCLFKTVGRSQVSYFQLLTFVSDIQRAVNNRPLTYRCSSDDGLEIITPNHFLRPFSAVNILYRKEEEDLFDSEPPLRADVLEAMEEREQLISKYKELWFNEYLLSLRESAKDLHNESYNNQIKIGDVVLIKSPIKTRPFWNLGRVMELILGDDGFVRTVVLKRGDGSTLIHPIKLLYPLELAITHSHRAYAPDTSRDEMGSSVPVDFVPANQELICICPGCQEPEDQRPMICCDHCDQWFHWQCVGIVGGPSEESRWYCSACQAMLYQELIWICPECQEPEDYRPMICCDRCDQWIHWQCAGIDEAPAEEDQWYCSSCADPGGVSDI